MLFARTVPYVATVVPPGAKPGPGMTPILIQLPSGPLFFAVMATIPDEFRAVIAQLTLLLIWVARFPPMTVAVSPVATPTSTNSSP